MSLQLDKINPEFREIVDLLFFTNRNDLDLSKFKELLKENYSVNFNYLWDRFSRSIHISWENNQEYWQDRFSAILSINDRNFSKRVEDCLRKRMFEAVRLKHTVDTLYDVEYLQFVEFCKVKYARKESMASVKTYLTDMPSHVRLDKLIEIVNAFIPTVFPSIDEYVEIMSKKIVSSTRNYDLLLALESKGITFDKKPIITLIKELIFERDRKSKNCRAFYAILNDKTVRDFLKEEYTVNHHSKILTLIKATELSLLEDGHLRNIKNLIDLDNTLADSIGHIFADKVYSKGFSHRKANSDKLIRLLKTCPEISQKKILVYLSGKNKMVDIKYMLSSFPELKKLAAFI